MNTKETGMNTSKVHYKWSSGISRSSEVTIYILSLAFFFIGVMKLLGHDILVALLLFIGGILHLYMAIAYTYNSTLFFVDSNTITIVHKPVPWIGNRVIAIRDIQKIFCRKLSSPEDYGNNFYGYHYYGKLTNGKRLELISTVCINKPETAVKCMTQIITLLEPYKHIKFIHEEAHYAERA